VVLGPVQQRLDHRVVVRPTLQVDDGGVVLVVHDAQHAAVVRFGDPEPAAVDLAHQRVEVLVLPPRLEPGTEGAVPN
jgi:hypothetical protein